MLPLFRDGPEPSPPPKNPLPPTQPSELDYLRLIDLLQNLRQPIDNYGETVLTPEEASALRELGWTARANVTWYAALIPWAYLAPYRVLWHLDDSVDPLTRQVPWHARRAAFFRVSPIEGSLGKLDRRILHLLDLAPSHALSRIALQRRLWRIPGAIFNYALDQLIDNDRVTLDDDGFLHPLSRHQLELQREMAARPRLPVPIYTS